LLNQSLALTATKTFGRTPEAATAADLPTLQSSVDSEISNAGEQESQERLPQIEQNAKHKIEIDAERRRSSIDRLTSNSIGELKGLASELRKLDEFLKSETGRVQREIESVLAGIKLRRGNGPHRRPPGARELHPRWREAMNRWVITAIALNNCAEG
jgi:hypothetical protein